MNYKIRIVDEWVNDPMPARELSDFDTDELTQLMKAVGKTLIQRGVAPYELAGLASNSFEEIW